MLIESEELRDTAVCSAEFAPLAIPFGLDLVGFDFPLVGEVGVPTARVVRGGWHADVFSDDGGGRCAFQSDAQDLAVAAPEILNNLRDFQASGSGGGAYNGLEMKT